MNKKIYFDNKFLSSKPQIEKRNPNVYKSVRILFLKNRINKKTLKRLIKDLTYTHKNSKLYKNTVIELNTLIKQYHDYINSLVANTQDENIIEINDSNYQMLTTQGPQDKYGFWIHKKEVHDMMIKNQDTIIIHKVEFFIDNIKQDKIDLIDNNNEEITRNLKEEEIKFDFIDTTLTLKELGDKIDWYVTISGSGGIWVINAFRKYCDENNLNWSVKIITKAYKKINDTSQLSYLQKYAFNNNGTCVYDGLVDFFSKYQDTKNKHGIAIYNKLYNNPVKYAKAYTIEDMEKLGQEINCSFTINDLINNKDIDINKNSCNRFNISFVNTRYNHLDLLKCVSNVEEIATKKYEEIKSACTFYVEKMGSLLTLHGNYKIKNQYSDLVNEWKEMYNINSCSIEINSDINKFINKYDDKVHRFFNNDMIIDNSLYNELDLKKAYYNYNKCNQYVGLPSGAYISCSGVGMTDKIFIEQYNNKLVGFYEVIPSNNKLHYLGFSSGKKYVLFSATIKLLLDNGITFTYINYVVSPAIDCPFNENFLKYIDGDELVDKDDNKGLVKAFCKTVGCMMIENNNFSINVKPDSEDKEFYKTMAKKENIYKVDGLYKVIKTKDSARSLKHMALSIHAYSSTIILEQMLKMNLDDVMGVKVDSIVFKKGSVFEYDDKLFKAPSKANIESMLKTKNYMNDDDDDIVFEPMADDGTFWINGVNYYEEQVLQDNINGTEKINKVVFDDIVNNEYFKPYFISKKNDIKFDAPFCGVHITERVVFLGGAGGCGKTHSILSSSNFMMNDVLFTSTCWELIQGKVDEFDKITGISLPKLTGEMNGKTVEKFNSTKYKYIVNDELTLQSAKTVNSIINDNPNKFIILMGDIEYDGFYYQCSIGSNVCNPSKIKCQYIKYTKNYRFEPEFNDKVNHLRTFMNNNRGKTNELYDYVKTEFSTCFHKNIKDIKFGDDDIGISALKPIGKDGNCLYSHHFYKQGAKEQYYIKDTVYKKGLYRGAKLDEQPDNKNYTNSLFRTIHAYQGRQLTKDNKIIILLNSLFDFNLLYTSLSRARRLDQIIIFDMLKK
jgi:hypothetical protein